MCSLKVQLPSYHLAAQSNALLIVDLWLLAASKRLRGACASWRVPSPGSCLHSAPFSAKSTRSRLATASEKQKDSLQSDTRSQLTEQELKSGWSKWLMWNPSTALSRREAAMHPGRTNILSSLLAEGRAVVLTFLRPSSDCCPAGPRCRTQGSKHSRDV